MDSEKIKEIGIWVVRSLLIIGAIVAGLMGNAEVSGGCLTATIISFILL